MDHMDLIPIPDDDSAPRANSEQEELTAKWIDENITYDAMLKRLHEHSGNADINDFYPPNVVAMLEEMAKQAGAPVLFAAALFSAICLAAGPNVRASAIHEGRSGDHFGWTELFNLTTFLASRSGGGKRNIMRLFKAAFKEFERMMGPCMTTNFTIEALLGRIGVHGSACICLDEGKRLRNL